MNINILSYDVNQSVQPQFMERAISYNKFDIQRVTDNEICQIDSQMLGCATEGDEGEVLDPKKLPTTYKASMQVSHTLNQLADEDGVVDDECTRAFIKKIVINENASYLDCIESEIEFDELLMALLNSIPPESDTIGIIVAAVTAIKNDPSIILTENRRAIMDIVSSQMNITRSIKSELFQFNSIDLNGNKYFVESFELEAKKSSDGLDITFKAKLLSLTVRIEKEPDVLERTQIQLDATCAK